jgi:hypothetical protein
MDASKGGQAVTLEQRIINIAEKQNYYDSRELRAIALEVRKREDRIKQLEDRINRASIAFFEDGSDARVARWMMDILEEERSKP